MSQRNGIDEDIKMGYLRNGIEETIGSILEELDEITLIKR